MINNFIIKQCEIYNKYKVDSKKAIVYIKIMI